MYEAAIVGPHTSYISENNKKLYFLLGDKHDEVLSFDAVEYAKSISKNVYSYIDFFKNIENIQKPENNIVVFIEAPIDIYDNSGNIPEIDDNRWKTWIEQNPALDVLQWFLYKHKGVKTIPVDLRFYKNYEFFHNMSLHDFFKFLDLDTLYCLEDLCDVDILQTAALTEKDYEILNFLKNLYANVSRKDIDIIKDFFISKFLDKTILVESLLLDLYVIGLMMELNEHTTTIFLLGSLHVETIKEFMQYVGMNVKDCQHTVDGEKIDQISVFKKEDFELIKKYLF